MGVYYRLRKTRLSSSEFKVVDSSPVGSSGWSLVDGFVALLSKTSVSHTSGGETSELSSVVLLGDDPVNSWVVLDSFVIWVDNNDFKEFGDGVLTNPVGVEDSHVGASSTNFLFGDISVGSGFLLLSDTKMDWLTVDDTLVNCSLSSSSSDSASVNGVAFLLLEADSSGLVKSRWSLDSVDNWELSVFPASNSKDESDDIRLLSSPEFL